MSVDYNHTIVHVRDRWAAAQHVVDVLGLGPVQELGPFALTRFDNGAVLCFADSLAPAHPVHHAFLVGENELDRILARVVERGLRYWADPFHQQPNRLKTEYGGRGFYWDDPDGNALEVITVPDGGWEFAAGAPGPPNELKDHVHHKQARALSRASSGRLEAVHGRSPTALAAARHLARRCADRESHGCQSG